MSFYSMPMSFGSIPMQNMKLSLPESLKNTSFVGVEPVL